MELSRLDELLWRASWFGHRIDVGRLFEQTVEHPLTRELLRGANRRYDVFNERLGAWRRLVATGFSEPDRTSALRIFRPFSLWAFPLAIAQLIRQSTGRIFGFAGPPGAGKTTLVAAVSLCIRALEPKSKTVAVSLDDFYYSKSERKNRGLKWRAQPGAHDIPEVTSLLRAVQQGASVLEIPRFDHAGDERGDPKIVRGPLDALLIEGWFLGMRRFGYEDIGGFLDRLSYIDCPQDLARRRRFERERALRSGDGPLRGMSEHEMAEFWRSVLGPGIERWVKPIRRLADLVIRLGPDGEVVEVQARSDRKGGRPPKGGSRGC